MGADSVRGGIAGAATAASLALRGWQVRVLDAAAHPAAGASGLPAGLIAPHVTPDDAPLSRLTRSGMQAMLWHCAQHLKSGRDWQATGLSGTASYNQPGAGRFGTILSGSLEQSNVDIAEEMVGLITAQRYFQANAKAIDTATQLSQTIVNLRT